MPAILEADDLHAQYGSTMVLHGLRFAVEAGGITTILGANGAGKTTTLRAVCAMVKTSGEVRFDGQRIDGKTTENIVRLGIAHVPQGRGTFVDLTVEENCGSGRSSRDRSGLEGDTKGVPAFPVLAERRRQQAGTLSGGEQQMLAVARALMSGPRLLLPTSRPSSRTTDRARDLPHRAEINRGGRIVLLVEQTRPRARPCDQRICSRPAGVMSGRADELRKDDAIRRRTSATRAMIRAHLLRWRLDPRSTYREYLACAIGAPRS